MRAVGFDQPGRPEVLRVLDIPEPHAGPGQVRISVKAATVNPSDIVTRSGAIHNRYRGVEPPYIPGWDASGVIDEADPDTGWQPGDRVMAITLPVLDGGGAYAERIVVPTESVVRIPDNIDFPAAATLPMNGLTAACAVSASALSPGNTIAVTGAAGAVGGYVIALARNAGLTVVADAAPKDEELVSDLGADVVVRRGDNVAEHIRERFPIGVDALVDAALQRQLVLPAIRDAGAYIALRPAAHGYSVQSERSITMHEVRVANHIHDTATLHELAKFAEAGKITLRVAHTVPFHQAAAAHVELEAGGVRGRLVLEF